jgi:hypothetical protein
MSLTEVDSGNPGNLIDGMAGEQYLWRGRITLRGRIHTDLSDSHWENGMKALAKGWTGAYLLGAATLWMLSASAQQPDAAQRDRYSIRLRSRTFTPEERPPGRIQAFIEDRNAPRHVILQFKSELTPEQRERLRESGFVLHGWLGSMSYSASLPAGRPLGDNSPIELLRTDPIPFQLNDKLAPSLWPEPDLRLMTSVKDVSLISTVGKNLIIVAAVGEVLHFRIFDGAGNRVEDTDEKSLSGQARQIEGLRKELESLWPPHALTRDEKERVINSVTSIVGHTAREPLPEWAVDAPDGPIKVLVQFFPDVTVERIRALFKEWECDAKPLGPNNTWATKAPRDQVVVMAGREEVRFIQPGPMPLRPLDAVARLTTGTESLHSLAFEAPEPHYDGLTGKGTRIGICDTGIDAQHHDFDELAKLSQPVGSRILVLNPDFDGHGTHVASIAAGNGFNSLPFRYPLLRGHAPEAQIGAYPELHGNANAHYKTLVTDAMDVTNHSYVQTDTLFYDTPAHEIDLIVRGDAKDSQGRPIPARPQVWAAGNNGTTSKHSDEEGYYSVFTSAKNTISVGSIDALDGHLSAFSSLGPTFDGRIKPDIVAPGAASSHRVRGRGILAAERDKQTYIEMRGTSMAAPVITATVALLLQQARKQGPGHVPRLPSTFKAVLVQTARDCVHPTPHPDPDREVANPDTKGPVLFHEGPDYATGFGLVDAHAACTLMAVWRRWREGAMQTVGQDAFYRIDVPPDTAVLKVTLAWDDEPADPTAAVTAPKLVNDLDLVLIDPDNHEHLPWVLDPLPLTSVPGSGDLDPIKPDDVKPAHRGVDRLNNVEVALVHSPIPGEWKARVRAHQLRQGSFQAFSLAGSAPLAD